MNPLSPFIAKPSKIRLEATTFCQLKCPSCPTADGSINSSLGSKHLDFQIFESLLKDNPQVKHVELANWGELFLNPNLLRMMELAYVKGVKLTALTGSNLNYIKPEVIEGLVKYKFDHINCSIDGVSQEVYEQYRRKGKIENVFKNIEEINRYKKLYDVEYPKLNWQFIIFKHNFHEIPLAKELARKYNMHITFKLSWDDSLVPDPKHREWIFEQTGLNAVSRSEYKDKNGETYARNYICSQLWNQPQINSDGRVLGCCVNTWGDFGIYKDGNLSSILNGERMVYARKMLMGKAKERKDIPCTSCHNYIAMRDEKSWLSEQDIGLVVKNSILSKIIRLVRRVKNKVIG